MLYTNRCLEFNKFKGKKVLEISSVYGQFISINVDKNMTDKIHTVDRKFYNCLTLTEIGNGKLRLDNKKDDDLYIILDTSEYKNFNCNSTIEVPEDCEAFDIIKNYSMQNRSGRCKWNILILKFNPNKNNNSIIKWKDTAGQINFITIDKKGHLYHINKHKMENFVKTDINDVKFKSLI